MAKKTNGNGNGHSDGGMRDLLVRIIDQSEAQQRQLASIDQHLQTVDKHLQTVDKHLQTGFRAIVKAIQRRDVYAQETSAHVSDLRERVQRLEAAFFQDE